jgi:hypothetical protein
MKGTHTINTKVRRSLQYFEFYKPLKLYINILECAIFIFLVHFDLGAIFLKIGQTFKKMLHVQLAMGEYWHSKI